MPTRFYQVILLQKQTINLKINIINKIQTGIRLTEYTQKVQQEVDLFFFSALFTLAKLFPVSFAITTKTKTKT